MTTPRPTPPHRLATTLTTLVLPLAVTGTAVAVGASWAPRLPDPVATHWGPSGAPDGFGSLTEMLLLSGLVVPVLALGMWALAFFAGRDTSTRRLAAAASTFLAVMMSGLTIGSLAGQLDLPDAAASPDIDPTLGVSTALGVLAAVVVALLVPRTAPQPATAPPDAAAPRTDLAPTERAAWSATVTSPVGTGVGAVATITTAVLAIASDAPYMLVVPALLGLLLAATLVLRVSVDARGLVARSPLGWPSMRVPLDEVVVARVATVEPLREFGGWGYRVGAGGRVGFVLRRGEAVEVERTGGRVNVVTVDDAATAAALLNTLAERSRSGRTTG
ncbi:DUF1648 domain-containing protein [Cellulomonas sp. zg-ZUI222]|uniref:DUF1648 domain-containing protein n=1 Tax=Cellulomonas wangleii TaxID=2816956 RepID=A0ABX8DBP3_9CELL|nr:MULTISPECIES: DUF1648 domain-containing protein [Cellulomonas]MBO0900814.1 DUF1648 domain-containing protein [Cellulomonas sp. zg-ZUI22]MBO0921478.1 DUF1648 domain-containing protein [Cellulomonas wangleii]MBO0924974.1 DUF1648 domain-containing protein [Cellulomonas wangleii]QVI63602.1 DUF1648 domain-containing protein [Cellulomonas wangleii]